MDIYALQTVMVAVFHLACIFTGGFIVYLGYRLFTRGITRDAGDVSASYGKYEFTLKRGAPGTFFVIFGCGVIAFSVYKGILYTHDTVVTDSQQTMPVMPKPGDGQQGVAKDTTRHIAEAAGVTVVKTDTVRSEEMMMKMKK